MEKNEKKIRNEAVDCLIGGASEIVLEFGDESAIVGNAGNFVGGIQGSGFISMDLGNVLYSTASDAVDATIEYYRKQRCKLTDWWEN